MTVFILLFNIVLYSLPAMAGMAILGYSLQGKYPKTSVGWLTLAGVPLTLMFFWGQTAYYDLTVDRLCAIDGGIKVYEQVVLSANQYMQLKTDSTRVPVIRASQEVPSSEYFIRWDTTQPNTGLPRVQRSSMQLIRARDGKCLAEEIRYFRKGGDAPSPMTESSYSCPKNISSVIHNTFIKGE